MLSDLFLGHSADHVPSVVPHGFAWIVVQFWNLFEDKLGYDATIRLKDTSEWVFTLLAGIIIGGFLAMRFHHNLMKSPEIDKVGTLKIHGTVISNPKNTWETIDTLTAVVAMTLFPKEVVKPRNMRRAKVVGRVLWVIAILLILFAIVMSNFVMLDPFKDYISKV